MVVVGGGVSGLGAALALGRTGHEVEVLERDATPLPADPHAAFEWDRRGAPQVRHSHAFLARLRNLLRDRHPDVLTALLDAGATELRFCENLPETIEDQAPRPGDEDLVALACRRTTFEWVLRRIVTAESNIAFRDGVAVAGLTSDPGSAPSRVTGVTLEDGSSVAADLVVVANGRRSVVPDWFDAVGAGPVPEHDEDTGIIYYSRFYRLAEGKEPPPQEGPIGGDLGYLKFAIFQGDNGTFSVTLAAADDDKVLRRLRDVEQFDRAARQLVPVAPWLEGGLSEPITEVHSMARLRNRLRRFVVDGRPLATGVAVVGDASVCTNPLYGRGCSLGMVHAQLLADAVAANPDDPAALALAFHDATVDELVPWYDAAVAQDRMSRLEASSPDAADGDDESVGPAAIMRDGLMPAVRTDADVFRAFLRSFNLLSSPEAVMGDPTIVAKVMESFAERDQRPPPEPMGPSRPELLEVLDAA